VRAELRTLDSADAPEGLAAWEPADLEDFAVYVAAVIGPAGESGGELFYFTVCSPRWLDKNAPPKGFAFMHGHVLLPRWDAAIVERAITDLCRHTEGEDWSQVAEKLSRYADWEFADYREAQCTPGWTSVPKYTLMRGPHGVAVTAHPSGRSNAHLGPLPFG
jgi:hypothetical protein